jgi:4-hydroxybenzoate polyprenyltransferase
MFVKVLKFFTSTSLFLALNGLIVVMFGYILYGIEINLGILLAAFLATFSVYSLNKATDKVEDSINRPETTSRGTAFYVGPSIVAMLFGLGIGAMIGPMVLITLTIPIILALVYSVRLLPSVPRLKEVVGVKSVLVALSWAFTGSLLPASMQAENFEMIFLVFTYIFIQLLVNTILFDVQDMKGDLVSGVETIPIRLGTNRNRKLLVMINSFLGSWLIYCLFRGLFLTYMPALIFGVLYGYVVIWVFSNNNNRRFFAELMVDGEWLPIVALLKAIPR